MLFHRLLAITLFLDWHLATSAALASTPPADTDFPSDAHVAIVYYTGSLTLEATPGAKGCVLPPTKPTKLAIKAVSTSSPAHPDGYNFFFWQDKTSQKWIYGGDVTSLQSFHQNLEQQIEAFNGGAVHATPFVIGNLQVPADSLGELTQLDAISSQLLIRNRRENATTTQQLEEFNRHATVHNMWLLPSIRTTPTTPHIPINSVSIAGVIGTDDLKQCPFTHAPFLPDYFSTPASHSFAMDQIEDAEAWIAGYCAANNHTIAGRTGKDVFGVAFLGRLVTTAEQGYNLHYYVAYGCLDKSGSGSIDKYKYGVAPEFDLGLSALNPASSESQKRAQESASGRTSTSTDAAGATAATSDQTPPPPSLSDEFFQHFNPTLPSLSYDKTSGLEQSINFTFQPTTPPSTADATTTKTSPQVTLPFGGMNSFEHDYYSVSAGPKIAIDKNDSIAGTFDRSELPKGGVTQTTTDGKIVFAASAPSDTSTFTYNATLAYSAISTPVGTSAKASTASAQNTDEYSGTGFFQQLFYLGDGMAALKKNDPDESTGTFDPSKLGPNGELDLNAWFKPTESSQNSNFYADILSRAHVGVDVPTPDFFPGPIEFLRLDFSLTGGGIVGVSPTYDRFNAGSNLNEAVTTPDIPAQPTVRSLGTNSANVYNPASKTSGATSYGNASFTVAIPVPYLSWTVYHRHDNEATTGGLTAAGLDNIAEQNNLDYVSYYADILSLRPLLACDAAYLGAPSGFQDRSLVSLGAGGELSLGPLNVDFLYAKTYVDTSTQTKSANLTVQVTYDIHF